MCSYIIQVWVGVPMSPQHYIFLSSYATHWCYKCFYTEFLDCTVRLLVFKKKSSKLDFSHNRLRNVGIVLHVYLKIPNSMYNRMSTYASTGSFDWF